MKVARDGAFDAETGAAEIEPVTEVARGVVFAIGSRADRAAAKVRGERTFLVFAIHGAVELHVGANRESRTAVGSGNGRPVVAEREFRRLGSGNFLRFGRRDFRLAYLAGERLELRLLRFEQLGLRVEQRALFG